ncbi:zinc finger protein [Stylonychia lemnae]|uniref:Zinc finger protein n=1 Tax=Stylonychia lemnae TaxID=5949 RepID=A0A077ZWQ2_STYLE|nr:zinc finger protein [Stylonychia lemnae]|eukprot:CDW74279.1 zinc finger protein [Stylonychia lemnae]
MIEMRENPKSHSQDEQTNFNKNSEDSSCLNLSPPRENIQENLRRISTRQQKYRKFKNNVESQHRIDLYSEQELLKVRAKSIFNCIMVAIFSGICLGFGIGKRDATKFRTPDFSCDTPISTWLIVVGASFGLDSFLYFVQILITFIKQKEAKNSVKLIGFRQFWLMQNFKVAWLIYGNTFHYNSDSIRCKDNNDDFRSMWILMMIQIAVGYINFFCHLLLVLYCFLSVLYLCASGAWKNLNLVGNFPFKNTNKSLDNKDFESIEERNNNTIDCQICLNKFLDDDEITELNCDQRHYFHTECIQTWTKRKLECPLCKEPVQPVARI